MKYVYLVSNMVNEIIPENNPLFPGIPVQDRYSQSFLNDCVPVSDDTVVEVNMVYDEETQTFAFPPDPEPEPVNTEEVEQ